MAHPIRNVRTLFEGASSSVFDFRQLRTYILASAVFSLFLNLLYLGPSLYMLQVYDRVLGSGSRATLGYLTVALVLMFVTLLVLDACRGQIMARAGVRFDGLIHQRVLNAAVSASQGDGGARSQPMRDLDTLRQFISSPGMQALFDLPWFPIYLIAIFLLHPILGLFTLVVAAILVGMALINEIYTSAKSAEASAAAIKAYGFTEMALRNRETIMALGMMPAIIGCSAADRRVMLRAQIDAIDRSGSVQALIKVVRMLAQSLVLAIGAYLVIDRQITGGGIFAGMLLLGRALQPIELGIGSWRSFNGAREAHARLAALLANAEGTSRRLALPRPSGTLTVDSLVYAVPGMRLPVLRNVSFALKPGETLGVIGPSGAGKSTLARLLLGIIAPVSGHVRLDGADISRWPRERLGPHLGYLPQTVELFADTVAANIARLGPADPAAVIAAAQLAGAHELILQLPEGYDTKVTEGAGVLSGGFRQRIGLARAVYGKPSFVLLDEPSSNLDANGDQALTQCVLKLKALGSTVVVISHRPQTVGVVDKVLVLDSGAVAMFGERQDVLSRLMQPTRVPEARHLGGA